MKLFIGIFSTIVVLTGAVMTFLALWNIYPISWILIMKAAITVTLICVTFLLLWLIKTIFFKNERFKQKGNN